jgi:hypothetical protein
MISITANLGRCATCRQPYVEIDGEIQGWIEIVYDDKKQLWFQPHREDCPRLSWPHHRVDLP